MGAVIQADRVHVLQRLRDLRDWARFIHESVAVDQPFEQGKRELLRDFLGEPFLREFQADSLDLTERLDRMIDRLEASATPRATAGCP